MTEVTNIKIIGGVQEISIPNALKIDDDKVYLKKIGNALYVIPFNNPWQNMLDSLSVFTDDFMIERNQSEEQRRESFD